MDELLISKNVCSLPAVTVQRGQMEMVVHFWDINQQRVCTHYWYNVFLGRATAEDLLVGYSQVLMLPLENLLQLSMDGPNKLEKKKKKVDNPDGKFLDVGTCGVHTVNGAVKTGHQTAGWEEPCMVFSKTAQRIEQS
ncbi:hypothetical protein PR048_007451, partial [Dryococelus australis]